VIWEWLLKPGDAVASHLVVDLNPT